MESCNPLGILRRFWQTRGKRRFTMAKQGILPPLVEWRVDAKVRSLIGKPGMIGYCRVFWQHKKRILLDEYGLDWKSPADLNPAVSFD
ncbi:MAG: hypothetical protein IJE07_09520 [Clostridia bacterium]|nr:hypothetical protein [Clostridia bacterium]